MVRKFGWIFALAFVWSVQACERNVGPLPESQPEYEVLFFSGEITAQNPPTAKGVVFVAAAPLEGGPPPLVTRINVEYWPVPFTLSDMNMMVNQAPSDGPMRLFARFDTDGDVNTAGPFDLEIRTSEGFAKGTTGISLTLEAIDVPESSVQVSGTVRLDRASSKEPEGVLYVSLKGASSPMPLVAKRFANPVFPMEFTLDDSDLLQPGKALPEQVELNVRIDSDGDPMTRNDADWNASPTKISPVHKDHLDLVLRP